MNESALGALVPSETLLRQITENIHEVFWVSDPENTRMLYVSPAYEKIWGRSVESLYRDPTSFLEAIHPEDRPRMLRALAERAHEPDEQEYRIIGADGSVRWIHDQAFPVRNERGEVYRWTGLATDITERKLAQDEIHRLNEELEQRITERTHELAMVNANLEREITEHYRTEEALREAQAAEQARTQQIRLQRNVLLKLAQHDEPEFERALVRILEEDASTMNAERVSFCSFVGDPPAAEHATLYLLSRRAVDPSQGTPTFSAATHPRYFAALATKQPIVAHRACEDPATSEFKEDYLQRYGITSMLDVAVWLRGRIVGVLCHEHVGPPRDWTPEEVDFAASIATMVSLALEASHRQTVNANLEREIAEHYRTEEALREAQAAEKARTELIKRHRDVLLELAQLEETDFEIALKRILKADAETLGVERVSYWSFTGAPLKSEREMLYLKSRGDIEHDATGLTFDAEHYPRYFAALSTHRPIVAHRAQEDPASSEFTENYLKPHNITSMLDVAVWSQGRIVGVLCHSHVGEPRDWTLEEVEFAASVGPRIALALEAAKRRELLEALSRSEGKYRVVVEHANEGIFITQDYRVRFANPRAVELLGLPAGQSSSPPLAEYLHPDDAPRVLTNYERRLRREATENNYTFRARPRDGEVLWLQINAVAIEWEGRPATLSFISDVTERTRLTENLRQTLSEREAILETTVVGIVFVQLAVVRWINTILETQMLGYDKGELVGKRAELIFQSHDDWKRCIREGAPLLARGERYQTQLPVKRKDGPIFWCDFSGRAIDPADLDKGSIWALVDVTERRALEEELNRTLAEREAILQNTLVGITFSVNRRHIWINQRMGQILGYAPEELIGQSSLIHFPDEESWTRFGETAYPILAAGESYSTELKLRRKAGELIWCQVQGTAIDPPDLSKGSIWTFTDISELKRGEEQIRSALVKEKELSELKSRFVSMTSHEFRTPLATILSATEMLERYSERLPAGEKSSLMELIKGAVKRMTHMLEEVLVIGRADSGRLAFNPQSLDVAQLARDIANEVGRGIDQEQEIVLHAHGDRFIRVLDEKLVRHIVGNLLSNAIKFSPPGSTVRFELSCRDGQTNFEISDQGIGIPAEDQPRLFETFYRARNVSNISGTGLGLAIVKRCVELHGGSISFESKVGRGTKFVVTLPDS